MIASVPNSADSKCNLRIVQPNNSTSRLDQLHFCSYFDSSVAEVYPLPVFHTPLCAMDASIFMTVPLIDAPIFVTVYEYGSESPHLYLHGSAYSQLWVADNGLVLYAGVRGHTGWNGEFRSLSFNMASLSFRFNGMQLYRWACGWFGFDNAGRPIRLTQLCRLQYDYAKEVWLLANDGTM